MRLKFLDPSTQRFALALATGAASKKPGSVKRRFIRGRGRVGASSAAKNSVHLALLKWNVRRSANASSARANALSRTNALTVRLETEAAASSVRLAEELTRRSSFSVRSVRTAIDHLWLRLTITQSSCGVKTM